MRAIQLEIFFQKIFVQKVDFIPHVTTLPCVESSFMIYYLLTMGWGPWNPS